MGNKIGLSSLGGTLICVGGAGMFMLHQQAPPTWGHLDASLVLQAVTSGVLMGGIYGLAAVGFSLIFGVMGIFNFSHGALIVVGMYTTLLAFKICGINPYISLLISIPLLFVVGILIQRLTIQRIMNAPVQMQILLTLFISIVITNLLLVLFKADPQTIQTSFSGACVFIGTIAVSLPRLVAFIAGLAGVGSLYLLIRHTDLGKAIRASAEEKEGAALVGINVKRTYLISFGLCSASAGAAGSLMMPFFVVTPTAGDTLVIIAFIVVVLGGVGSVVGSLLGGIIIGLVESLGATFLPGSSRLLGIYLILILILLFRPSGLLGKQTNG